MPLSKANIKEPPSNLPAPWLDVLTSKEPTKAVWEALWKPMAKELPKTIRTFKKALQRIGLLTTKTRPPSLVYVVTEDDGDETYGYRGFAAGAVKHPEAKRLPPELLETNPPRCHTVWPDDKPQLVRDLWRRLDEWISTQNEDLDRK